MSGAHRAALRFVRGGLVATLGLLAPSQVGLLTGGASWAAAAAGVLRVLLPILGFTLAGVIGASALDRGRRGGVAFGAGFLATGVVLTFTAPLLSNLSGFERPALVLSFGAASAGAAFGVGGILAALALESSPVLRIGAGFALGGVVGGVLGVLPAVLAAALNDWPAEVRLFANAACALAGFLAPFGIGGAVAGRALEE